MLKKVNLKEESIEYIQQQLSMGGVLSSQLMKLNLYKGSVFTFFPSTFSPHISIDFSESLEFLTGEKVSKEFDALISDYIVNNLGLNERKIAIFETMWNINDPIVAKRALQYFSINGRKYDFVKGRNDTESIINYINDARGYPTVISIIETGHEYLDIKDKSKFKEEKLSELADSTEVLIIGAFDGEGYLLWQKDL